MHISATANAPPAATSIATMMVPMSEMQGLHKLKNEAGDETTIWRYMDLSRLVSLLATGSLWFAKAATFNDDPYEGFGRAARFTVPVGDNSPKCIARVEPGGAETSQTLPEMLAEVSGRSAEIVEKARQHIYVNSWCRDAGESMAMWEIYGSHGLGVAVKSSVGQYKRAAKFKVDPSHYLFGNVTYHSNIECAPELQRDFTKAVPLPGPGLMTKILPLGLNKRDCYKYEQEWRAVVYQDIRPDIAGISEEFDLKELISGVYLGPRTEDFLFGAVSSLLEKFKVDKPLERSVLLDPRPKAGKDAE